MQLDFTSDQDELRAAVQSVLDKECTAAAVRAHVDHVFGGEPSEMGAALWRTAVRLDWPALCIPEADGGVGLGMVELAVMAEELGKVIAPGPLSATLLGFLPAVRAAGLGAAMSACAAGRSGAVALAGQGGAFDASTVPATATGTAAGDGAELRIDGECHHVVGAGEVDDLAVALRMPDGTLGLAVIPIDAAGVHLTPVRSIDFTRAVGHVRLDGVVVAAGAVAACGEGALRAAAEEIAIATALELVGTCQTIFDTTVAYAKERVQFGVPIGSFQAVKHKIANMYVALERARAVALFAAATVEEDDDRRAVSAAMAKAAAGECQRLVAADGIQLLGGIGYTWEHDQHMWVKRAHAAAQFHGAAREHRAKVAQLLGL